MKRKNVGLLLKGFIGSLLAMVGGAAFAQEAPLGPDFSSLTSAVHFDTAQAAILGIMAALAVLYVVIRGGSLVLSKIRR